MLQWTGGRGGGHHSKEDIHQPLIETYATCRRHPNLIIILGSGFGAAEDTLPYLTGEWSERHFGLPRMPVDGILLGSRAMIAAEAETSDSAKAAILAAPGIPDGHAGGWESAATLPSGAGGVVSVLSELGEPIHKLATRGTLLWKHLDATIFSLPRGPKQDAALQARRADIIRRLNADFQKPWFGHGMGPSPREDLDLGEMTYEEVSRRLASLVWVAPKGEANPEGRWIHPSYRRLVRDWLTRVEERLCGGPRPSVIPSMGEEEGAEELAGAPPTVIQDAVLRGHNPDLAVSAVVSAYPKAQSQLLGAEDAAYFVGLCQRRGQKPVPFIPVMRGSDFSIWFKKDSLWQSEDVDAVVGADVGRVCVLQGPVSVAHSSRLGEPIAEILGSIHAAHVATLLGRGVPIHPVEAFGAGVSEIWRSPSASATAASLSSSLHLAPGGERSVVWRYGEDGAAWLDRVAGPEAGWLRALLCNPSLIQDRSILDNPWPRVFTSSVSGQGGPKGDGRITATILPGGHRIILGDDLVRERVSATLDPAASSITLTLGNVLEGAPTSPPLSLTYSYVPAMGLAPLHETMGPRRTRDIQRFYYHLWLASDSSDPEAAFRADVASSPSSTLFASSAPHRIGREEVRRYCEVIGNRAAQYVSGDLLHVPMDYGMVAAWRPMIRALFPAQVDGDLLRLVHLSNAFRRTGEGLHRDLREGDAVSAEARITAMRITPAGKVVEVSATVFREIPEGEEGGDDWEEVLTEGETEGETDGEGTTSPPPPPPSHARSHSASSAWDSSSSRRRPALDISSTFLFRGHFPSRDGTFEWKKEEPMRVVLRDAGDVAILLAKPWFRPLPNLDGPSGHGGLRPGSVLLFHTVSKVEFAGPVLDPAASPDQGEGYNRWDVSGSVLMQTTSKVYARVGRVEYHVARGAEKIGFSLGDEDEEETEMAESSSALGRSSCDYVSGPLGPNPVRAFLERIGKRVDQTVPLSNGGITLLADTPSTAALTIAPAHNAAYSLSSGDVNPIHTNPWIASLASLPGTITHGMWTSAATRRWVEVYAADAQPHRVISYDVSFVGMVLPGDRLSTTLIHTGMRVGRKVISIEVRTDKGDLVLTGTAQVDPPTTAYVFTGQGSQEVGMGMGLYAQSEVARAVWDRADKHFRDQYGISILEIVRENPKMKTVFFGGEKGKAIRATYMGMQYEEGGKLRPLFPSITARTRSYTFHAPGGLLSATQFTQPALTLMEKAAFEEMRAHGLIRPGGEAFAGHSLGEYSALASMGEVLPIESLVDVVFYRGMTMQGAVARDPLGRSAYGMCAVNPARLRGRGPTLRGEGGEEGLREVVAAVAACPLPDADADASAPQKPGLLEIVNYNVQGWQYVVAGECVRLEALGLLFSSKPPAEVTSWTDPRIIQKAVHAAYQRLVQEGGASSGYLKVQRGYATIPLPGIDVPFHSSFLLGGVAPFRAYLSRKIESTNIDVSLLRSQYIPNLTAEPFAINRAYVKHVLNITNSPVLRKMLEKWGDRSGGQTSASRRQHRAWTLLIELLAYQFASPVQWIKTQDWLFRVRGVERLIEVGPSPTLGGMAQRTLKLKYEGYDDALTQRRSLLCTCKDLMEICYNVVQEEPEAASPAAAAAAPAGVVAAPVAVAPIAAAAPAAAAVAIPDEVPTTTYILRALVAQKLKKDLADITADKTIKEVVGGKSTLQNEILGDVQKEFPSGTPDRAEELPLGEIGAALTSGASGKMGKAMGPLVARLVSGKMPPGLSLGSLKSHLSSRWGLGEGRSDAVLVRAVTMEPAARFGSPAEATGWLDGVVAAYARDVSLDLSSAAAGAASGGGGAGGAGGAVVDEAVVRKLEERQDSLVRAQLSLLARHLGVHILPGREEKGGNGEEAVVGKREAALTAELDLWVSEHGSEYGDGMKPRFSGKRVRSYDSAWNWVRQDALRLYYDLVHGRLTGVDRDLMGQCIRVMNRSSPNLIALMTHYLGPTSTAAKTPGPGYALVRELGQQLLSYCTEALDVNPVFRDLNVPTGPKTWISPAGDICYAETPREGIRHMEDYVKEMVTGSGALVRRMDASMVRRRRKGMGLTRENTSSDPGTKDVGKGRWWRREMERGRRERHLKSRAQENRRRQDGSDEEGVSGRLKRLHGSYEDLTTLAVSSRDAGAAGSASGTTTAHTTMPYLHLRKYRNGDGWVYSRGQTQTYLSALDEVATSGITYTGRQFLVTGAGEGSIGAGIVQGLLSGGAQVALLTSRAGGGYFERLYQEYGSRGSKLHVIPWNGASAQDVKAVVAYIYDVLGWDLDGVVPFGAISEAGHEMTGIDGRSELAHRIMLTNVLRLLGEVALAKASRGYETRPATCLLPLSPNHGTFGGDGLYGESKAGLETILQRWNSESWSPYLSIVGAVIGWTRGTGLMNANNIVAEGLEREAGMRTFSTAEMAFNLLGLLHPDVVTLAEEAPVWADLGGGFGTVPDLNGLLRKLRASLQEEASLRRSIKLEGEKSEEGKAGIDDDAASGSGVEDVRKKVTPRANLTFDFPALPRYATLHGEGGSEGVAPGGWKDLRGCIDLESVVVVVGMGEVGPWGSARTRWEMEAFGHLSLEGCVELAWVMGLVKPGKGRAGGEGPWWEDAKTGEAVDETDMKRRYEQEILEHTGIRWIEPGLFNGYDPKEKELLQEVVLDQDMEVMTMSRDEASAFALRHKEKCLAFPQDPADPADGPWGVQLLRGATLLVPKALRFDRNVAGQVPTGWDAARYGVPADIISQVDPVTLYVLVATMEALAGAGITDPYELYNYVHVSEVGNCIGSGLGGALSAKKMYRERYVDRPVQKDILQETFINTMPAWVNMLLLSASGPIKTPVGACATAVESVDIGVETIRDGKARVVLVGGFDDFQEEGSYEFANMGATSSSTEEAAKGRGPREMSRPTATSRAGFMEAHGAGVEVLMTAALALEMGVPIRAIVALSNTAMDKEGRSIPAPGQGILTTARERPQATPSPLLDLEYRRRQLRRRKAQVAEWVEEELEVLGVKGQETVPAELQTQIEHIHREAGRQEREAAALWGGDFWRRHPEIAPLRGALAAWGLGVDDVGVASFHGTSTQANDKNESEVLDRQLRHLGRAPGNPVPGVFQKYLTGHPKGAAAAWMLHGVCQVMETGLVPGNRNADNVDTALEPFDHVVVPSRTLETDGIRAGLLKSFGFGQVGGEVLLVHPHALFAALEEGVYESYRVRNAARHARAYRYMQEAMAFVPGEVGKGGALIRVKTAPPYTAAQEAHVYLDPQARAEFDPIQRVWAFNDRGMARGSIVRGQEERQAGPEVLRGRKDVQGTKEALDALVSQHQRVKGVAGSGIGVDVELVGAIPLQNKTFLERNFTEEERSYCASAADPSASLAGRWSAKEAVVKALGDIQAQAGGKSAVWGRGAGAPLGDIEIIRGEGGAPTVLLHGEAKAAAKQLGASHISVSISHAGEYSLAVATATTLRE